MPEMAAEAIVEALGDAGLDWRDVQAVVAGAYLWNAQHEGLFALLSGAPIVALMGQTGIPVVNCTNASATGTTLLREACLTVAAGAHDVVVAVAADKSAGGLFTPLSNDTRFDEDYIRWVTTGAVNPAYWAMECRRRMHELGTTEEDLALAKVVTSGPAKRNPKARYRREFTIEEVLGSAPVADPLRLLEICATSDGAAAVIVAAGDVARRMSARPVWVDAVALASRDFGDPSIRTPTLSAYARAGVPSLSEAHNCMAELIRRSEIGPDDLDVIELPDNSSWHYLTYLDIILGAFGARPGAAEALLREGATDPMTGRVPVGPGGGASGSGEAVLAQGLLQVHELVTQLRGAGGDRQVPGPLRRGLAMTYGYLGNNAGCVLAV
ncbi:thiolase C-terminal domain-containing protein [Actinophytocola sp.]|uniref:thiolase C-terminal domain-containing protein n=1 Tax=Actinophytocola sp. TaxID=1872138 RepID=UPI003D6B0FF9